MKLLLICSKRFYPRLAAIADALKRQGHEIVFPNCYDRPGAEDATRTDPLRHAAFKAEMFRRSDRTIAGCDGVLTLNFPKDGDRDFYIGGATFLEVYDAFRHGKAIYFYYPYDNCFFKDELDGFSPVVLNGDLTRI